jgi:dTDP-4-dehydrorhamnose reductase
MKLGVVGSGQVAQHIMEEAEKRDVEAVLIGRKDGKSVSNRKFDPARHWDTVDSLLMAVSDVDLVINTAAFRDLSACQSNPDLAKQINADLPRELAERGPRQIFISTDYVFRGLHESGRTEKDFTDAECVYGKSKAEGESNVLANDGVVVRIASPFGIYPSPERPSFVDSIVPKGIASGKLELPEDQIFTPTYLPDMAAMLLDTIDAGNMTGIYHMANSGAVNWVDFTKSLFHIQGGNVKIEGVTRNDNLRPRNGALLNSKTPKMRHWMYALDEYIHGSVRAEDRR